MSIVIKDANGINKTIKSEEINNEQILVHRNQIVDFNDNELFSKDNIGYVGIGNGHNPNLDSFGRLRVSDPVTIFDNINRYNDSPLFFETATTGSGSTTHLPNESAVKMDVTTTSGDRVIRQTYQYFRYQAGKSQLIELTGVIGVGKANVKQMCGYFDDDNGLFFEQTETALNVVVRTKTSGSVVESRIPQSSWNIDKLDGTGNSGFNLDMSKIQIFIIDFQWLGAGRIRFGFNINGSLIYCHEVNNANIISQVYMTTGSLPIRYEIINIGTSASNTSMKQVCCSVQSEGGFKEDLALTQSAGNGDTLISVTTRRPILSIRGKTTFNSIVNRGIITPYEVKLINQDVDVFYEIVWDGTLTGDSFSSVNSNSITEFDVSSTAISGGVVIDSGYITSGTNKSSSTFSNRAQNKFRISNNIAGNKTDILTVVCTSISSATNVGATLTFSEVY
jgi:hypothetical protein